MFMKIVAATVAIVMTATLALAGDVELQRCQFKETCTDCQTAMILKERQCHPHRFGSREIFCHAEKKVKTSCVRESVFHGATCAASGIVQSAIRELGACWEDEFGDPNKFFQYKEVNGTILLKRDCDFGCGNCGIEQPLGKPGTCEQLPIRRFGSLRFLVSEKSESCEADVTERLFLFTKTCNSEPNIIRHRFSDSCDIEPRFDRHGDHAKPFASKLLCV